MLDLLDLMKFSMKTFAHYPHDAKSTNHDHASSREMAVDGFCRMLDAPWKMATSGRWPCRATFRRQWLTGNVFRNKVRIFTSINSCQRRLAV